MEPPPLRPTNPRSSAAYDLFQKQNDTAPAYSLGQSHARLQGNPVTDGHEHGVGNDAALPLLLRHERGTPDHSGRPHKLKFTLPRRQQSSRTLQHWEQDDKFVTRSDPDAVEERG